MLHGNRAWRASRRPGMPVRICARADYSRQQFGQLATTTPTPTETAKITSRISPMSHCRRKNYGSHH
jgi:hypothetical protein